jgi:hypothetical protein
MMDLGAIKAARPCKIVVMGHGFARAAPYMI